MIFFKDFLQKRYFSKDDILLNSLNGGGSDNRPCKSKLLESPGGLFEDEEHGCDGSDKTADDTTYPSRDDSMNTGYRNNQSQFGTNY